MHLTVLKDSKGVNSTRPYCNYFCLLSSAVSSFTGCQVSCVFYFRSTCLMCVSINIYFHNASVYQCFASVYQCSKP